MRRAPAPRARIPEQALNNGATVLAAALLLTASPESDRTTSIPADQFWRDSDAMGRKPAVTLSSEARPLILLAYPERSRRFRHNRGNRMFRAAVLSLKRRARRRDG